MDRHDTTARLHNIAFGTGYGIYCSMINQAIINACSEVILVTCFWARSPTLSALNDALRSLSTNAVHMRTKVRVRICFSSSSVRQKLFHTPSASGQCYSPAKWASVLGLPPPDDLPGLDLRVKSIFCLPFSVMHPKFVTIDRRRVFLPSCNVSWEDWFEGCLEASGSIVESFTAFWQGFWADEDERSLPLLLGRQVPYCPPLPVGILGSHPLGMAEVPAVFLPSPYHRFKLPWISSEQPPATPLNSYLLDLFERAEHSIFIQTPNLTCQEVLKALMRGLKRGVNVSITTSQRLMRMEQIVTAGITTESAVKRLTTQYSKLRDQHKAKGNADLETGLTASRLGSLVIRYYQQRVRGDAMQSHLKLTIVDDEAAVFGSGNMDRASWFTSQELGLAIRSTEIVKQVEEPLVRAMDGRSMIAFDSEAT